MQDRYVGDIGDFGKYALLKALTQDGLRLGVQWYLNDSPESNNDGSLRGYSRLRRCDPHLFDSLDNIQATCRCVAAIERSGILPANTIFYSEPLPKPKNRSYADRRVEWHLSATGELSGADIVFLDPDNGLHLAEQSPATLNKHATRQELLAYLRRGQSVVVYHHQSREAGGIQATIARVLGQFRNMGFENAWALSFHRKSVRSYFVIPVPSHSARLRKLTDTFLASEWGLGEHFMAHKLESESVLSDPQTTARGLRLFHHLVNKANSGTPLGIGYGAFIAYLHGAENFRSATGRNYSQSDTPTALKIAVGLTTEMGRLTVTQNGHSIQAGLDTFIWSSQKPHDRPLGAWKSQLAPPYTREQWLAVFPAGKRRLITPDELKSLTSG